MQMIRYVVEFENGDIGKGSWMNMSKTSLDVVEFQKNLLNKNKFIKKWYIEYK